MRLLRFGKPELPLVISATFLAAISAFLNLSQNFFVGTLSFPVPAPPIVIFSDSAIRSGWLVDIVRFTRIGERGERLNHIVLILLGVYICDSLLSLFSGVLYNIAATRCSCRLRSLVLRNMLRQDVAFFDTVPHHKS